MRNLLLGTGKAKWLKDKAGNLVKPPYYSDPKWCNWREEEKIFHEGVTKILNFCEGVTPHRFEIILCNEKCWSKGGPFSLIFGQMVPEENCSVSTAGHKLMDKYWEPAVLPTHNSLTPATGFSVTGIILLVFGGRETQLA